MDPKAGVDDPETGVHDEENDDSVTGEDGYEGGLEDEDGGGYGMDSDGEGPKIGTTLQGDHASKRRRRDELRSYCGTHPTEHLPHLTKEVRASIKLMDALKRIGRHL